MSDLPKPDLSIDSYTTNAAGRHTYRDEVNTQWPESSFSKTVRAELDKLKDKTDKSPGVRHLRRPLALYRLNGEGKPLSWKELPAIDPRKKRLSMSSISSATPTIKKTLTGPAYTTLFETAMKHTAFKREGNDRLILLYRAIDFDKPAWQIKFTCTPEFRELLDYMFKDILITSKTPGPTAHAFCTCTTRNRICIIAKDTPGKPREFYFCNPEPFSNGTLGLEIGPLSRRAKSKSRSETLHLESIHEPGHETRARSRKAKFDGLIGALYMRDGELHGRPDASKEPWVYKAMQQAPKGS